MVHHQPWFAIWRVRPTEAKESCKQQESVSNGLEFQSRANLPELWPSNRRLVTTARGEVAASSASQVTGKSKNLPDPTLWERF